MSKLTLDDLRKLRESKQQALALRETEGKDIQVIIGMGTCGIAAGARPVLAAFIDEINKRGLKNVTVTQTGCIGVCRLEPIVEVFEPGKEKVTYVKMDADKVAKIVTEHLVNHRPVVDDTIENEMK